ncbi:MAG: hypothetical protein ACE5HX_10385, partial [bacterium]
MVQEKEALLINIVKIVDALSILIAFIVAYFTTYYVRHIYELGEMAYATAPNIEGLLFFTKKNAVLLASYIPIWLILLALNGAYKDIRTKTISKELIIISKSGILATIWLGCIIFIFKMTLTSRLFIGIYAILTICFS